MSMDAVLNMRFIINIRLPAINLNLEILEKCIGFYVFNQNAFTFLKKTLMDMKKSANVARTT